MHKPYINPKTKTEINPKETLNGPKANPHESVYSVVPVGHSARAGYLRGKPENSTKVDKFQLRGASHLVNGQMAYTSSYMWDLSEMHIQVTIKTGDSTNEQWRWTI